LELLGLRLWIKIKMAFTDNLMKWQNYAHYVLLAIGLFVLHALPPSTYLEGLITSGCYWGWILLFIYYTVGLFIVDTLIHLFFYFAPEPVQWRD